MKKSIVAAAVVAAAGMYAGTTDVFAEESLVQTNPNTEDQEFTDAPFIDEDKSGSEESGVKTDDSKAGNPDGTVIDGNPAKDEPDGAKEPGTPAEESKKPNAMAPADNVSEDQKTSEEDQKTSDSLEQTDTGKKPETVLDPETVDGDPELNQEPEANLQGWSADGTQYFDAQGNPVTGVQTIDGNLYYFDANGIKQYGQHKVGNDENGTEQWICADKATGILFQGITELSLEYNPSGVKTVYYHPNSGFLHYGALDLGGRDQYYFDTVDGHMLLNTLMEDESKKKVYYGADGRMVRGQQNIDGRWYYFDKTTGEMVTSKFVDLSVRDDDSDVDKTVYYGHEGHMLYGQQEINDFWYCFNLGNGAMMTGMTYLDRNYQPDKPKTVFYNDGSVSGLRKGAMVKGLCSVNGDVYYFAEIDGARLTKTLKNVRINGTAGKAYFGSDGKMVRGEAETAPGQWRYFDRQTGLMVTGWKDLSKEADSTDSDKRVYYGQDGLMVHGQMEIDGYWYCFNLSNGAMKTGMIYLDRNYQPDKPKTVFYNDGSVSGLRKGAMVKGLCSVYGDVYYFAEIDGARLTKTLKNVQINGTAGKAYFGSDGKMVKGEAETAPGQWRYFDRQTGLMITGWKDLSKEADSTDSDKRVYYGQDGIMVHGEKQINGYWFCFSLGNGAMQTGVTYLGKEYKSNAEKRVYYMDAAVSSETPVPLGAMLYGDIRTSDGRRFYANTSDGALKSAYVVMNGGELEVYDHNGYQGQNMQGQYEGHWYYFGADKKIVKNQFVDLTKEQAGQAKRVYYDENGWMVYGMRKFDDGWKFFHFTNGAMARNELISLTKQANLYSGREQKSIFNADGNMVLNGTYTLDGRAYRIDSATGAASSVLPSWCYISGGNVIFDPPGYPTQVAAVNSKLGKLLLAASECWDAEFTSGGRNNNTNLDCIGFVMRCYNLAFGLNLQADSVHDFVTAKNYAYQIPESSLQRGDLVVFRGTWTPVISHYTHSSIYLGNGMIMYMTYSGVTIGSMYDISYHDGGPAPREFMRIPV